jgi:hypothetical protein
MVTCGYCADIVILPSASLLDRRTAQAFPPDGPQTPNKNAWTAPLSEIDHKPRRLPLDLAIADHKGVDALWERGRVALGRPDRKQRVALDDLLAGELDIVGASFFESRVVWQPAAATPLASSD